MSKFTRFFHLKKKSFRGLRTSRRTRDFNSVKLRVVILGLIIVIGVLYLFFINNVSTSGFEIKKLEQKIELLKQKNKKLELRAASLQSLQDISKVTSQLGLTDVAQVEYLEVGMPAVALGQ